MGFLLWMFSDGIQWNWEEMCPLRWPPRVLGAAGARLPEGGLLVCSRSGYRGLGYRDGDPQRAAWQPRLPLFVLKV